MAGLTPPAFITFLWNEQEEDWDITSNCHDQGELIAAISEALFRFAMGEMCYRNDL